MSDRFDPRALLLSFGLLLPVLLSANLASLMWWSGLGMVVWAVWAASLSGRELGRGLFRLRWLFFALLVTHGMLTPGEVIGAALPFLTWEGVLAGSNQAVRLLLLVVLALALGRLATPLALVGGLGFYLGWLERFGMPVRRGLSILNFCLVGLGRFQTQAARVRETVRDRIGEVECGWVARLDRLAFGAAVLLRGLLWDLRRCEEGLRSRGFEESLPLVSGLHAHGWRRMDGVLVALPALLWWVWWMGW
ncbi:MAG: hypothetical protein H7834_04640 [Magnetococcus sp. YQC-9]